MNYISTIFEKKPVQWGLRGDPHLWSELKDSFNRIEATLSKAEFEEELINRYNKHIEQKGKKTSEKIVWFKHFPQSGMSGGSISLVWWQETGLPLLMNRYQVLNK